MTQTLLIELLTEELPPKALAKLGAAFADGIVKGLKSRDFLEADSVATAYATPRRLAVSITKVRATSPDKSIREKVLPVSVALDAAGNGTPPLAKKLAALGFPNLTVGRSGTRAGRQGRKLLLHLHRRRQRAAGGPAAGAGRIRGQAADS
jgi:glycyl-tRNA synthetase beta chain